MGESIVCSYLAVTKDRIGPQDMDNHVINVMLEQILLAGLPESESSAIAQHLATCRICQCGHESLRFWTEIASGRLGVQGPVRRRPVIQSSPPAGCAQKAALKEDVEQLLELVIELMRKERDVLREDNHAALIPILGKLGLASTSKRRPLRPLGSTKDHGC